MSVTRGLSRHLDRRIDLALAGSGISGAQLEMLDLVSHDRNAHAAALARSLGISRQSATRLVARLVRADLVDLLAIDFGVRVPVVTHEGRRRSIRAHEATAGILRRIETIDLDDRAWFVEMTSRLVRSVGERDDPEQWPR